MSLPLPPEHAVVQVFEWSSMDHYSYRAIVEKSHGEAWGPISIGTVSTWVKQGLKWWNESQRLAPDEEYGIARQTLEVVMSEIHEAYRRGDLDVAGFAEWSLKTLAEHRKLTQPAQQFDEVAGGYVNPRAQAAIDELKRKRAEKNRKVITG